MFCGACTRTIGKLGGAVKNLRRETEELGRDTETVCVEGRQAHTSICARVAGVGKGLGEIRGELKGVTRSIDSLREDFRARVFGSGGR